MISGNKINGIGIANTGTTGNIVTGNRIGTNADGNAPLPNSLHGVVISNGSTNNTIGGTAAAGQRDLGQRI